MSLTVNIYPFIEFIQGNLNELSSGHIAALEAGFRVYSENDSL
jgi:hypothetical protein